MMDNKSELFTKLDLMVDSIPVLGLNAVQQAAAAVFIPSALRKALYESRTKISDEKLNPEHINQMCGQLTAVVPGLVEKLEAEGKVAMVVLLYSAHVEEISKPDMVFIAHTISSMRMLVATAGYSVEKVSSLAMEVGHNNYCDKHKEKCNLTRIEEHFFLDPIKEAALSEDFAKKAIGLGKPSTGIEAIVEELAGLMAASDEGENE